MHYQPIIFCAIAFTWVSLALSDGTNVKFGYSPELDVPPNPPISRLNVRDSTPLFDDDQSPNDESETGSTDLVQRSVEVQFGHDPTLDGNPPIDFKIRSRGLEPLFDDDQNPNDKSETGETDVVQRSVEVQFGHDPTLDGISPDASKIRSRNLVLEPLFDDDTAATSDTDMKHNDLESRQVEVTFGERGSLDGAPSSAKPGKIRRGLSLSGIDTTVLNNALIQDMKCANKVRKDKQWKRDLDQIDRRMDQLADPNRSQPAEVLWTNPALCMIVNMGMANFVPWDRQTQIIGTNGMCGCIGIAITTTAGAILAHFSPNPDVFDSQLDWIQTLFQRNLQGTDNLEIYLFEPADNGVAVLPGYVNQLCDALVTNFGIDIYRGRYNRGDPNDVAQSHVGTIVVQFIASTLYVWVNNVLMNRPNRPT